MTKRVEKLLSVPVFIGSVAAVSAFADAEAVYRSTAVRALAEALLPHLEVTEGPWKDGTIRRYSIHVMVEEGADD